MDSLFGLQAGHLTGSPTRNIGGSTRRAGRTARGGAKRLGQDETTADVWRAVIAIA